MSKKLKTAKQHKAKGLGWAVLKPGDMVDMVAPGFSTTDDKVKGAIRFLNDQGLKVRVPNDLFGTDVVCAQKDSIRLQHLKDAFEAKDSQAVWCIRGGYGIIRLLPQIKKWRVPKRKKLFIGYSDACSLHNLINHFWKWPTLHGPLLDRLGSRESKKGDVDELLDVVFGRKHEVVFDDLRPLNESAKKSKTIQGKVYGGNLKVVNSDLGTPFQVNPKNAIIIFEDTGERGYRVDRSLVQLQHAGYFKGARAIVFGDFIGGQEPGGGGDKVPAVLERFAQEMKIPVFNGLPIGHGDNQRTVPLNTSAQLKTGASGVLKIATGGR